MNRPESLAAFVRRIAAPVSDEAAGGEDGPRWQFAIFACLFAIAVLFDRAELGDWKLLSHDTAIALVAIFVLLRPSSVKRFVALLVALLIHAAIDSPLMTNHWTLIALTSFAILVNLGVAAVRRETWLTDAGAVYRRIAPVLRVQVLILYLFAAFAKINGDFFDPALSCGVALSRDLFNTGPLMLAAAWQEWPVIVGTVAIELVLPLLLLIRRTRLIGVFAGAAFHVSLAIAGHISFSGFAMAFYVLFLPDDLPARLRALRDGSPRIAALADPATALAAHPLAFPLLAGAWILVGLVVTYGPARSLSAVHAANGLLFMAYVAALAFALVAALRRGSPAAYRPGPFRVAHAGWGLAAVLAIALASSPYLGLRAQDTFTMYSNLQTEGDQWNHALLPEAIQVFSMQDDLVRIVSSSDPLLARNARTGTRMVWWDFRRHAGDHRDASVTYERRGIRRTVARIGDDSTLSQAPSALEEKILMFRDVPPREANSCRTLRPYDFRNGS